MEMGWISLHRKIRKHWIWKDPNKLKWWIDILLEVNHEPAKVNIGNELYECNRGQSIMSLQNWADRWKVSKGTARCFLKLLENDSMITHESLTKTTRITVCNYDNYQQFTHDDKTMTKRKKNDDKTLTDPNNNNNKDNNENKYIAPEFFEIFMSWLQYKKEIKDSYKSEKSERVCYDNLIQLSGGNAIIAKDIINQSIGNGWKGLFPLKNTKIESDTKPKHPALSD